MRQKKKLVRIGLVFFMSCCLVSLCFLQKPYTRMDVVFDSVNTPCISVSIQGKPYILGMDFGSSFDMSLRKEVMASLEKTLPNFVSKQDIKGYIRHCLSYQIDKVRVGGYVLSAVRALEMKEDQSTDGKCRPLLGNTGGASKYKEGYIGRPLLEKMNLLMDFSNSVVISFKNKKYLTDLGYHLDTFTKVGFQRDPQGIVVLAQTSRGELRLLIDTGCTVSTVKSTFFEEDVFNEDKGVPYLKNSAFSIGDRNFGEMDLYVYAITTDFRSIDGILGMDFLSKHIIYIDQEEQAIYIGDHPKHDAHP